jgi:hypothetical protein
MQCRVTRWFLFKPKIPKFGKFWRALDERIGQCLKTYLKVERRENVDIFFGYLEYFKDICDIYDHLVRFVFLWYNFFLFWYHVPRKIWQHSYSVCT